jgi:5-methylcytosine-specific restriction endonuclease McrA
MSPILKRCVRHGLYQPGAPSIPRGRCPACYAEDNQGRKVKQREHGRTTSRWRTLARAAKQRAGYRCQNCGAPEVRNSRGWLSVHLRPELGGNHRAATLEDVVVLCLSCHGTLDAPRAQRSPVL